MSDMKRLFCVTDNSTRKIINIFFTDEFADAQVIIKDYVETHDGNFEAYFVAYIDVESMRILQNFNPIQMPKIAKVE